MASTRSRKTAARSKGKSGTMGVLASVVMLVVAALVHVFLNGLEIPEETPQTETRVAASGASLVGRASILDADTIEIHGERIRFNGIDAPESGQQCLDRNRKFYRCGTMAANALDAFVAQGAVTCEITGKDRYGRNLGGCSARGIDLQEWLVLNGHAVAYRQYSKDYIAAEEKAKAARAGMWAGEFVLPWDWRKGARLPGEKPTKAMLEGRI